MKTTKLIAPIAITMGDAAGIGPETIAMLYQHHPHIMRNCFVVGDVGIMRRAAQVTAPLLPVAELGGLEDVPTLPPRCIGVLPIAAPMELIPWGTVNAQAGAMAGRCVEWAANAALNRHIAAMVTAPLNKASLHAAGMPYIQFPGHTELLQYQSAQFLQRTVADVPVRMMLANAELRTVLVSIHVSLRQALEAVTRDNVLETIWITHQALTPILGRPPRIAVAGLNPHAGEDGLFGREEIDTIAPAIEAARVRGAVVSGPFPPDTVFMRARQCADEIDVVIAMYHDQGLIPVKYLGVENGVNVTLGLPLIRTSPDHGTAFDIAGTGKADPSSLLEALRMARLLAGVA
jgi:4-hydroxythreonine-4-phosphate dehydrogenase